jgi:hypothetical protein
MKRVFLGQKRDPKKYAQKRKVGGASRKMVDTKSPFAEPCSHRNKGTIALDPTFGSFTLLEPVSHEVN